jgi:hypothetical protein
VPRTLTAPPTDRRYWRRLLRLVHPDGAGDHDLFIWTRSLFEHIAGDDAEEMPRQAQRQPPKHHTTGERVPYEVGAFDFLTRKAVAMADDLPDPFARLLHLLDDCEAAAGDVTLSRAEEVGATYKQLAYIAHLAGMSTSERMQWYRIGAEVPLSQRHAGHLVSRLKEEHDF